MVGKIGASGQETLVSERLKMAFLKRIPRSGKMSFRVKTGLFDFHLRLSRVHRRLSLFRQFPTDSGRWRLEEFTHLDFEDLPFRAVIQIDGIHRLSELAANPPASILGCLRDLQGDRPCPALIRFEVRPEVDYPDWFHAQPGADTPWLVGMAECGAYQLQDYFESVLTALEEFYPGLIEFDMPAASPEGQTIETVQHNALPGKQQAEGQSGTLASGLPEKPDEPSQQDPVDVWFDWYHQCKRAGFKVTLREIGDKIGYKESTMKQKHALYKAERGRE